MSGSNKYSSQFKFMVLQEHWEGETSEYRFIADKFGVSDPALIRTWVD